VCPGASCAPPTNALYGNWFASGLLSGIVNWSEIGVGWITTSVLFCANDASPKSSRPRLSASRPAVNRPTRSTSGVSVTSGDGSKRQPSAPSRSNTGLRIAYGSGQSGNDGLRVPNDPSTGAMFAGDVL